MFSMLEATGSKHFKLTFSRKFKFVWNGKFEMVVIKTNMDNECGRLPGYRLL